MFTILTSMMISSAAFSLTKDEASRMADAGMCSYGADEGNTLYKQLGKSGDFDFLRIAAENDIKGFSDKPGAQKEFLKYYFQMQETFANKDIETRMSLLVVLFKRCDAKYKLGFF